MEIWEDPPLGRQAHPKRGKDGPSTSLAAHRDRRYAVLGTSVEGLELRYQLGHFSCLSPPIQCRHWVAMSILA